MTQFWIIRAIWWAFFGWLLWAHWAVAVTALVVAYGVRADLEDAIKQMKDRESKQVDQLVNAMLRRDMGRKKGA